MRIETNRLLIRDIMAEDGTLNDVGFDKDCGSWMGNWIVVGSVGCSYYEDLCKTGITYFTGAKYRNMGYAVEALEAYVKYYFDHYDVPLMIATIREENVPSRKVIERAEMYCFYEKTK